MSRLRKAQHEAERVRLSARFAPSARDMFPVLRDRLLASRPVIIPQRIERPGFRGRLFGQGLIVPAVYGKPTFRNVIEHDEKGRRQHV